MSPAKVVRGYGPLDAFLAEIRRRIAENLITNQSRLGRILDIGCGEYPLFLEKTQFNEKYGLDKGTNPKPPAIFSRQNITRINQDLTDKQTIPFDDDFFDVVTMLAVLEHIEPENVNGLLKEIRRVLKPDGRFILTTPAAWSDWLLRFLSHIKLISAEEIQDHKTTYRHKKLTTCLEEAGFKRKKIKCGFFECYLNLWAYADK